MLELLFFSAVALSIIFCIMPGAVNAEALRHGLRGGFRPALMVELGSVIGDRAWAFLALVGLAFLVTNNVARIALGISGCALLFYLAYKAFLDARKGSMGDGGEVKTGKHFLTGALISLGSPLQIVFWLGIGGSAITVLVPNPGPSISWCSSSAMWPVDFSGASRTRHWWPMANASSRRASSPASMWCAAWSSTHG
ncbi:MAG: LysE family transporter [Methanomassiliicoccales archaeon]